ncbi:MAG: aldehyde-activating protein [Sphingobium sp.]|nr:aldehyde-activating protein [Sphingobium sp.]
MQGELTGGCLCGAVRYTLRTGFRMQPYACHCTLCQSRTGSAFSEHMMFARQDLEITGELDKGDYVQPSGAGSAIWGCALCKTRIFSENNTRPGFGTLRCGTLDRSAELVPAAHIWVGSKQPWITLPPDAKVMDEQPRSMAEWAALVGPG